eukprot:CAMPEP_0170563814 /NCGR_PEP_ID=MMETSP0211-20121228/69035_1 /TAXON_ID=311385 /ORGANISM="Pseudokeronopsis sp., Strain OXSARD2" /LENGTH=64 /DNA_ID=CAMNT_0010882493 /DNA_START=116 /DNA_END=306 /DNA_ORIENTATION=+
MAAEQKMIYKPREKKDEKLSAAYLTYISKLCKDIINFLGYSTIDNKENSTGYFAYEEVSGDDRA